MASNKIVDVDLFCSIRLSPHGFLHFEIAESSSLPPSLISLQQTFLDDWRAGWFRLAADKLFIGNNPSIRFWQEIASYFLTALCHLPADVEYSPLEAPETERLAEWILRAPPMAGGEYLSLERMIALWEELNKWVASAAAGQGGIHQFLTERAPQWQQVGRVCFHLAENKKDLERPFAFLATYSTGFGAGGKLRHLPLKEALKQHSETNNNQTLIKLLTPVHQASQKCQWLQELVASAEIYQPLAWPANKAYKFLCSIPQMEESGLSIRIPNWWKRRPRPQVSVTIGSSLQPRLGISSMLDFDVKIAIGDDQLSEEELTELLASGENLACLRGQWVEVDRAKLQEALKHWKQVQKSNRNGQISFIEGMRLLAGAPSELETINRNEEERHWVKIAPGEALSEILRNLRNPSLISSVTLENLNATLRPYQNEGLSWLSLLSELGLGACLADDMGLGKTIQILSLLLLQKRQTNNHSTQPSLGLDHSVDQPSSVIKPGQSTDTASECHATMSESVPSRSDQGPSLLIVPASLLSNWKREADRFTPSLKLLLLHPAEIKNSQLAKIEENPSEYFQDFDLVVTTYSMIVRMDWLSEIPWNLLILDEAQAIKNAGTKQTKSIKALKSRAKIALTGTPIENRLSDLWSLFDFLNPGLLGSSTRFKEYITGLQNHPSQFESLRKLVAPYILRRMKTDPAIISDLPNKIETPIYCHLTKLQAQHYGKIVDELRKSLNSVDPKGRRGLVLRALLQLKQICNHPSHYTGTGDYLASHSGKFERLGEICEELASRQEKVLVFTQFSEIIPPLEEYLSRIFGRRGLILHGGTPIKERKGLVDTFQSDAGPPFFILSLKAGGTGLTLTAASHVIHFDRWWNPAVENQATDRAFRIGQKKNVQVHKFITQGTVEEQVDAILNSKKKLANDILASTDEVRITELSDDELLNLLAIDLDRATAQ